MGHMLTETDCLCLSSQISLSTLSYQVACGSELLNVSEQIQHECYNESAYNISFSISFTKHLLYIFHMGAESLYYFTELMEFLHSIVKNLSALCIVDAI